MNPFYTIPIYWNSASQNFTHFHLSHSSRYSLSLFQYTGIAGVKNNSAKKLYDISSDFDFLECYKLMDIECLSVCFTFIY